MSSAASPIPPARFAAALRDLPLSSLYAKAAEVRNSVAHLQISNAELKPLADQGDDVCKEAWEENVEVIRRMEERLGLLRAETEMRGQVWHDGVESGDGGKTGEGGVGVDGQHGARQAERNGVDGHEDSTGNDDLMQGVELGATFREVGRGEGAPTNGRRDGANAEERQRRNIGDDEMARRLRELMDEQEGDDGVHL